MDDDEPGGLFTVHWLNNKELQFTLAMEVFLEQLRGSLEQRIECSNEGTENCFLYHSCQTLHMLHFGLHYFLELEDEENSDEEDIRPVDLQGDDGLPVAAVEHQVDVLIEEWNKAADMLFSIHPIDGSLLVWHVDWLDEFQPGMFRQTQVLHR